MIDFTSALYLGFRHACGDLTPWASLTAGKPAALFEPDLAREIGANTAALQGCEAGLVAPSTLHLYWDLFGWLSHHAIRIYLDGGAYPISRWGVERAEERREHSPPTADTIDLEVSERSPHPRQGGHRGQLP